MFRDISGSLCNSIWPWTGDIWYWSSYKCVFYKKRCTININFEIWDCFVLLKTTQCSCISNTKHRNINSVITPAWDRSVQWVFLKASFVGPISHGRGQLSPVVSCICCVSICSLQHSDCSQHTCGLMFFRRHAQGCVITMLYKCG